MFLITPDQKMLKSPSDLKLYIAKSGAIIDSNIVNFSLPKKTAKVDKMFNNQQERVTQEQSQDGRSEATKKSVAQSSEGRTGRRETKLPLKYRDFSPDGRSRDKVKSVSDNRASEAEDALKDKTNKGSGQPAEPGLKKAKTKLSGSKIGVGTFSIDKESVTGKRYN